MKVDAKDSSAELSGVEGTWVSMLMVAAAGGAVGVFVYLFNLGTYTSYNVWPTRYHIPMSASVDAALACTYGAVGVAGALVLLVACLTLRLKQQNPTGLSLEPLRYSSTALLALWVFPVLFALNLRPNLLWLFLFLAAASFAAYRFGIRWRPLSESSSPSEPNDPANGEGSADPVESLPPVSLAVKAILAACMGTFILLFSTLTILQYHAGHFGYADSGFVAEALHNSLRGHFLLSRGFDSPTLLADHFSLIWLPLIPVYAIVPRHETLMVLSSVVLSITAIPVFLLARWEWKDSRAALFAALAFLLYPATQFEVFDFSYGFQAEDVAIPLFAWACYYMRRECWKRFAVFLILAVCCKETLAAMVVGIGLFLFFVQKERKKGVAVAGFGVAWFLVTTLLILPYLKGGGSYYQFEQFFGENQSDSSGRLGRILTGFISSPFQTIHGLLHREVWMLLLHLLLPLGLLSLLSPSSRIRGLPHFVMTLLSHKMQVFSIHRHYRNPLIIVSFVALIIGVRQLNEQNSWLNRLMKRLKNRKENGEPAGELRGVCACLLVASLMNCYYFGPTPLSKQFDGRLYTISDHALALARMKDAIPLDASLGCTQRAGAHFTDRRELYVLPLDDYKAERIYQCDYILLDRKDRWGDPTRKLVPSVLKKIEALGTFKKVTDDDGFMLFKRQVAERAPDTLE